MTDMDYTRERLERERGIKRPIDLPSCDELLDVGALLEQAEAYEALAKEESLTRSSINRFKRAALAMRFTASFITNYGSVREIERITNEKN